MKKRNGIISLWKFLFSIVIAFFHGSQFYNGERNPFFFGGYISVEFFFIVSGFYLAYTMLDSSGNKKDINQENALSFTWGRIKGFLPYIIIVFILSLIIIVPNREVPYKLSELVNSVWNLFLLRTAGFRSILLLGQFWYLTAYIISMSILYLLLKRFKEKFILNISPLIIVMGLGYLNHNWLGLDHAYHIWNGYFYTGILRAFIELNIGFVIYLINQKLQKVDYTSLGKWLLTLVGEGLLLIVLFIISFIKTPKNYDYIMLFFISIAITIFVSEKTYEYDILSVKFFYYLEKLSMPIFINHTMLINFVYYIKPFKYIRPVNQSILAVVLSIIFSLVEYELFKLLKRKQTFSKIKKILIVE